VFEEVFGVFYPKVVGRYRLLLRVRVIDVYNLSIIFNVSTRVKKKKKSGKRVIIYV